MDDLKPIEPATQTDDGLYERDFHAWTHDRAEKLRRRTDDALDWANIAEEIESLGNRDKREVDSRLMRIIQHLLKWEYQPERRSRSWLTTIGTQRNEVLAVLEQSPSLRGKAERDLAKTWRRAARLASDQTGIPLTTLPGEPSYALERILDPDFLPGASGPEANLLPDHGTDEPFEPNA